MKAYLTISHIYLWWSKGDWLNKTRCRQSEEEREKDTSSSIKYIYTAPFNTHTHLCLKIQIVRMQQRIIMEVLSVYSLFILLPLLNVCIWVWLTRSTKRHKKEKHESEIDHNISNKSINTLQYYKRREREKKIMQSCFYLFITVCVFAHTYTIYIYIFVFMYSI